MRINLGSGLRYLDGYINIDKSTKFKTDLVFNLEQLELIPLNYQEGEIDEINASHILEHIHNIIPLMNECYRILKKGGKMFIEVPQGDGIWADPTHVRAFNLMSFRYYCDYYNEIYGITCKFRILSGEFIPNKDGGVLKVVLEK